MPSAPPALALALALALQLSVVATAASVAGAPAVVVATALAAAGAPAAAVASAAPAQDQHQQQQQQPQRQQQLTIHCAMHSHDDVGWMESYLDYYSGTGDVGCSDDAACNVSRILSNVVAGLGRSPRRVFSVVEQAFFQLFFEQAAPSLQAQVRALVAAGQLVFLNGGFSMHDDATATATDMLDNTALGHRHISENFGAGALPTLSWSIDPFGHSAFSGVLSSALAGSDGVMWSREPFELWNASRSAATLERVWLPSTSRPEVAAFQGTFASGNYASPGGCRRCDQGSPFNGSGCSYVLGRADGAALAAEIVGTFVPSARGRDVLLLFGQDFTGENAVIEGGDADPLEGYFAYVEGLIDALNADTAGRFNASFSSPAAYVRAKLDTVGALPAYAIDFLPYNNDERNNGTLAEHEYWSGFFSSRTAFKGFVRASSALQQAARQLQLAARSVADPGPANSLFKLERALGVAQHHDAVSGTATEEVTGNYAAMLEAGRADAFAGAGADIATLTGYADGPAWQPCPLANVSICPPLEQGRPTVAVLYNALAQALPAAPVRLPVDLPVGVASFAVSDADGAPVVAQLVPMSKRDTALRELYGGSSGAAMQWLCFTASLPPTGFANVFIEPVAAAAAAPHTHASKVTVLWRRRIGAGAGASKDAVVSNGRLSVTVSAASGWPSAFADAALAFSLPLVQSWRSYIGFSGGNNSLDGSSQASGQYVFRPQSQDAQPIAAAPAAVTLITGPVVNMSLHAAAYVTQETRLWARAESVEVEYTVGPVDVTDGQSREIIARYETGLNSSGAWRTDSNCREMIPRLRNARANFTLANVSSEPVASNYYPITCLTTLSSGAATLAVAVDRAQGGSSLADGALELMVLRRLLHLDGREPLGEPLNEPGLDGAGIIVRGRHWLVAAPAPAAPSAYKHAHSQALALPTTLIAFAGLGRLLPSQWRANFQSRASLLSAPLPENVFLMTAHDLGSGHLLLRLAHLFDAGEDAVLSADVSVDLAPLLAGAGLRITQAVDMTLPGALKLSSVAQRTLVTDGGASLPVPQLPAPPSGAQLTVTLRAQEIRTLRCTIVPAME